MDRKKILLTGASKPEKKAPMNPPVSSPTTIRSVSEKRLALYGVAAGAALAAGVSPAQAAEISLDLTGLPIAQRSNTMTQFLYFDVNAATPAAAVSPNSFAGNDFRFSFYSGVNIKAYATAAAGNGVAQTIGPFADYAQRFTTSQSVGPANSFGNYPKIASNSGGVNYGNFAPGDTGYIGLRFQIGADSYYGWANLTLNGDYTVTLNTLGYEDVANAPSHVGPGGPAGVPDKTNSLALLAIGAAGLVAFRSRQAKAA
jgi:hypothetical protein